MAIPSFVPPPAIAFTRPFWDGVAAGELRLPRCSACGAWQWYPLPGADHCPGAPLAWTSVVPAGTIFSFTVVRRPFLPGSTKADVPITTLLVELDEAPGLRLVGRMADGANGADGADGAEARVGLRVRGSFVEHDGRADLEFVPLPG